MEWVRGWRPAQAGRPVPLCDTILLQGMRLLLARSPELAFERHAIDLGISETCAIGDFNGDGRPGI
jgi:hypothetical protein